MAELLTLRRAIGFWCFAGLLAITFSARADPLVLPYKLALQVMMKVLTYDRNLTAHGKGPFTVLIVSEPSQQAAREKAQRVAEELRGGTEGGRPIRFVQVQIDGGSPLREAIRKEQAAALLVLPGISTGGAEVVVSTARETNVYTLTLDPELVQSGFALGVEMQDGRPHILLNQAAARAANALFESTVLKLARVVPNAPVPP